MSSRTSNRLAWPLILCCVEPQDRLSYYCSTTRSTLDSSAWVIVCVMAGTSKTWVEPSSDRPSSSAQLSRSKRIREPPDSMSRDVHDSPFRRNVLSHRRKGSEESSMTDSSDGCKAQTSVLAGIGMMTMDAQSTLSSYWKCILHPLCMSVNDVSSPSVIGCDSRF